jgi:hypothetical protein
MKCNKTLSKWCKNKHGASKIADTLETYQRSPWPKSIAPEATETRAPGVIDQISQTGRSAIARSIDWHTSRLLTPAEVVGIKCGSGGATQSPERARGRRRGERGGVAGRFDRATWSGLTR